MWQTFPPECKSVKAMSPNKPCVCYCHLVVISFFLVQLGSLLKAPTQSLVKLRNHSNFGSVSERVSHIFLQEVPISSVNRVRLSGVQWHNSETLLTKPHCRSPSHSPNFVYCPLMTIGKCYLFLSVLMKTSSSD